MHSDGKPYCQICMNADHLEELQYRKPRQVPVERGAWGGPITTQHYEGPAVHYRCTAQRPGHPHEDWVDVGRDWQPPAGLNQV